MSETAREYVPTRVPHFSLERLDDETLLYHPGLTKAMQLNDTAALIWDLCDGRRSIREIAALLADVFPDDAEQVLLDVEATLQRLSMEGAVRITAAP